FLQDGIGAIDGLQVPAQRQHIAPIAFGMEQGFEQAVVGPGEGAFELRQPVFGGDRNIVRSVQHWRSRDRPPSRRFPGRKTYTVWERAERPAGRTPLCRQREVSMNLHCCRSLRTTTESVDFMVSIPAFSRPGSFLLPTVV